MPVHHIHQNNLGAQILPSVTSHICDSCLPAPWRGPQASFPAGFNQVVSHHGHLLNSCARAAQPVIILWAGCLLCWASLILPLHPLYQLFITFLFIPKLLLPSQPTSSLTSVGKKKKGHTYMNLSSSLPHTMKCNCSQPSFCICSGSGPRVMSSQAPTLLTQCGHLLLFP